MKLTAAEKKFNNEGSFSKKLKFIVFHIFGSCWPKSDMKQK